MPRHRATHVISQQGAFFSILYLANKVVLIASIVIAIACVTATWELLISNPPFSISDSAIMALVLIVLAMLGVYRKMSRSQAIMAEHPVTSNGVYRFLREMSPLGGGMSGCVIAASSLEPGRLFCSIAAGAVSSAILAWLMVDPVIGFVEMGLPSSQRFRRRRMSKLEGLRRSSQTRSKALLAGLQEEEVRKMRAWQQLLNAEADELTRLTLLVEGTPDESKEAMVAEIGARAYKVGGTECMKYLYSTVEERCKARSGSLVGLWFVSIWWDGIGDWRSLWMEGEFAI